MKRRTAGLIAGNADAVSIMPMMSSARAAAGGQVDHATQSQWAGGFQAALAVRNLGDALDGWALKFAFADSGQKVGQGWSGTWSQAGTAVSVSNLSWNSALPANGSLALGFVGSFASAHPFPSFQLNGAFCAGNTGPSTPTSTPGPSVTATPTPTVAPTPPATTGAPVLRDSGNQLVTSAGVAHRLLAVFRSGGEFACIKNRTGIRDGPMDQTSVTAMRAWKIGAVRVPLNEECWLGTTSNPVPEYSGAAYQNQVKRYVSLLVQNRIAPIVELHWSYGAYTGNSSGCADVASVCQKTMPDAQYAPAFWSGVATAFKGNDAVILDLFNEPYPERATGDATSGWKCWRDGGICPGIGYQVAGFQNLVNNVRATGATNVLMLGGPACSNDLTQWLAYRPTDPQNNLIAMAGPAATPTPSPAYNGAVAVNGTTTFGFAGKRSSSNTVPSA